MDTKTHSGLGVSSFVISLLCAFMVLTMIAIAGVMEASMPGGMDDESPEAVGIGCGVLIFLLGSLLALGLGIGALFQQNRSKAFPIIGIVIAGLTIFSTLLLIVLGLISG